MTELREQARKQRADLERRMMGDGSDEEDEKEGEGIDEENDKNPSKLSKEDSGCSWGMGKEDYTCCDVILNVFVHLSLAATNSFVLSFVHSFSYIL